MRIVFCASEVVPFAKTGGLADVAGALPLALEQEGQEIVIIMPYYKEVKKSLNVNKSKEGFPSAVIGKNIKVYFIENDLYFDRQGLYGDAKSDYKDNLERFSYYCKRSLDLLKEINFVPDIIHIHDWQASLIPVYLKTLLAKDAFFKGTKTVLTIHNLGYQGLFPKEEFSITGLDKSLFNMEALEFHGKINLLKGGIVFSDYITTVSPTYSREIQSDELGFGLEGVLHKKAKRLAGILNGLDYSIWDPENDPKIPAKYSVSNIIGKSKCKGALQELCGFSKRADCILFGIVSRLAEQKGFDLLTGIMDKICKTDMQLVILGTGDERYHKIFKSAAAKYKGKLALYLKFDDTLAHKIYAGADAFLMPSRYEPCGLGQIISLRYGTLPLVYKTGGLADTVTAKCGFVFEEYTEDSLFKCITQATSLFTDKKKWLDLMRNAFACDFSWEKSAQEYVKLYKEAQIHY